MAIKNILLLSLILLIVSSIEGKSQSNIPFEYKKQNAIEFNMGIFDLLRLIEDNIPLSRQKIESIGFYLTKDRDKEGMIDYVGTPINLNDGARLVNIDLWERNDRSGGHIFFILDVKSKAITRQELESNLGEFVLLPDSHITSGKTQMYEKTIRGFEFSALYTREPKNILLNVSFSSAEPLEQ